MEKTISDQLIASSISLAPKEIITYIHSTQVVSVGLPFLIAELEDKVFLEEAIVNLEGFKKLGAQGITTFVHILTRSNDEFDIRAVGLLGLFELNWQMEGSLGESLSKKDPSS